MKMKKKKKQTSVISKRELASLYGVSYPTLRRYLEPLADKLDVSKRKFTAEELEKITAFLG